MTSEEFVAAALRNPANRTIADELFHLALPDSWLVAGCLVQTVWNVLTDRAIDYGIADYDIFYFDRDTSWQAEDDVIRRLNDTFRQARVPVEVRNQARVHLPRETSPALPAAALFMRRHRSISHQEHADRFAAEKRRLRRLCARRI